LRVTPAVRMVSDRRAGREGRERGRGEGRAVIEDVMVE